MNFEVRGKIFGMSMPMEWKYYAEGLLVLPEDDLTTFSGEVRDENGTPIDVIVHKSDVWGGWVVLFRNYATPKSEIYQKFGVFTNMVSAIHVARLILTCNRAFQYNWKGITSIIMRGTEFDFDTAAAVALLHIMLPKTRGLDPIFNPPTNYSKPITNPVVFSERIDFDDMKDDERSSNGIRRKTRSYTRLFLLHYMHHVPGISFFNEDDFVSEVMHFVDSLDDGRFPIDSKWSPDTFLEAVEIAEKRLGEIFLKYEDGIVSLEFLKSLVARKDICMPGTNESAPVSEEDKKEEAFDAV